MLVYLKSENCSCWQQKHLLIQTLLYLWWLSESSLYFDAKEGDHVQIKSGNCVISIVVATIVFRTKNHKLWSLPFWKHRVFGIFSNSVFFLKDGGQRLLVTLSYCRAVVFKGIQLHSNVDDKPDRRSWKKNLLSQIAPYSLSFQVMGNPDFFYANFLGWEELHWSCTTHCTASHHRQRNNLLVEDVTIEKADQHKTKKQEKQMN